MKPINHKTERGFDRLAAACLTAVTFLALPYANIIKMPERNNLDLITIEQTAVPPPVLQPIPIHKSPVQKIDSIPKPQLVQTPQQVVPLQSVIDFNIGALDLGGDFDVSFAVAPPDSLDASALFTISDVDRQPQPLIQLKPLYPARARMRRIEGSVTVEFTVTENGNTKDIKIITADPPKTFNRAAARAIERWRFSPAEVDGKSVQVRIRQNIRFELK
jgi:TonB family protein